jgi:hypothetical protein
MIFAFVLGVLGIIAATFLLLFLFISSLFAQLSGWSQLAARYGRNAPEDVWTMFRESVKIGPVRYRRIVRACPCPEGLFLGIGFLLRHKTICIPWTDFWDFHTTTFYRRPCMGMRAGKPPIATILLSNNLYRAMWPYLRACQ